MMIDRKIYRDFDKTLLFIALFIFTIGLLSIYSATQAKGLPLAESYVARQASWMAVGIILLAIVINISYQKFVDLSYPLYFINVVLLILVLAIGHVRGGAQRWFSLGGFAFQPSEFIKLNLILVIANYVGMKRASMGGLRDIVIPCILLFIPFALVILQPDLGTALILLPVFFSILFIGGAGSKYLIAMISLGILSLPFFWGLLREYQRQRLLVFLNPNIDPLGAGYTIIQSKIAVGSGGLLGKGWLAGTQNQLNFLPERHTDFIFSVVGEEWGLLGAIVLTFLYFIIVKKAFTIASLTTDIYGKAIAVGIGVMIALQVIINVGMTIGLMPVVGIPLPLVSYGGSSLITTLIAIGLLLNIGMRRSRF
ncbi:MAG: rod shape-determining protein RodA [Candidatus Omnitrophota bacterium]|nr:rod shape-determining protein RodA [Candidatus Omnitrophota bacterium]